MIYLTCILLCRQDTSVSYSVVNGYMHSMANDIKCINKKQIVECGIIEIESEHDHDDITSESDTSDNNTYTQNYLGIYTITAYTWTGNTMANGEYPYVGCAASCDFPIGTTLYIEGIGTYIVNDVCPTSGVIDLYMHTYDECINFGRQNAAVYII